MQWFERYIHSNLSAVVGENITGVGLMSKYNNACQNGTVCGKSLCKNSSIYVLIVAYHHLSLGRGA